MHWRVGAAEPGTSLGMGAACSMLSQVLDSLSTSELAAQVNQLLHISWTRSLNFTLVICSFLALNWLFSPLTSSPVLSISFSSCIRELEGDR